MSTDENLAAKALADRVTELESLFLHMQRDLQALDEAVREQQQQLRRWQTRMEKLASQFDAQEEDGRLRRDPLDERPPHY